MKQAHPRSLQESDPFSRSPCGVPWLAALAVWCVTGVPLVQMSYALQTATRQEDAVCTELYVKETSMPPMVLAIGTSANHKELLRTSDGAAPIVKHCRPASDAGSQFFRI